MTGTDFDRKAEFVATAWEPLEKLGTWDEFLNKMNLGFPYAWLHYVGHGTLNKSGKAVVEETFDAIADAVGGDDGESNTIYALMRKNGIL